MNEEPDKIADKIGIYASNSQINISNLNVEKVNQKNFRRRNDFLAKIRSEIESRLEQSLHSAVLINIGKEKQFNQVKRSWDIEIKIGSQPNTLISRDTRAIDIVDLPSVSGRLLILGDFGSGKTTTLLEIAKEQVLRAYSNSEEPLPLLLNLSSWKDDKQALFHWVISELTAKYGIPKSVAKKWLQTNQVFPLLDGLNELEPERQRNCILAINELLECENQPTCLVVCCRREDYEYQNISLHLNGAIFLSPLSSNQIAEYLSSIELRELWESICDSPIIFNLVQFPLFLSMLALAYKQISFDEWRGCNTPERCKEYLLGVYINYMIGKESRRKWYKKGNEPKPKEIYKWLTWLALNLDKKFQKYLIIEDLQPNYLSTSSQIFAYRVCTAIVGGLLLGTVLTPITGLFEALIFSFIVWLTQAPHKIKTITALRFSWKDVASEAKANFASSVKGNCVLGIVFFLLRNISSLSIASVIWAVILGCIAGTMFSLLFGTLPSLLSGFLNSLQFSVVDSVSSWDKRVWKSFCNAGAIGLAFCSFTGLLSSLIFGPIFGIIFGVLIGLIVLLAAASSLIQHFSLRLILYLSGNIPWNYSCFLNYCAEKTILQRVGNQYSFVHSSLVKHLARERVDSKEKPKQKNLKPNRFTSFIIPVLASLFIKPFVFESRYISRVDTMTPMFFIEDRILVDKLSYRFVEARRGDIICFNKPASSSTTISPSNSFEAKEFHFRRIIGLPGERIAIRGGQIYVNSNLLKENYITFKPLFIEEEEIRIPHDMYLVFGDDRRDGKLKFLELVPQRKVVGRGAFRFWPLNRIAKLW